jgi:signal transduction histidine kinase
VTNEKLHKKEQGYQKLNTRLQDANNILVNENKKKDKSSIQLELDNTTLKKAAQIHQENKDDLENIMYLLSHKIRKEVANILGISNLLIEHADLTPTEISEMMNIIIYSAQSLNLFTEDISLTIHKKR